MKALLLALLLISQTPKFQISGGIGISHYQYDEEGSHSDSGVTFTGFFDYWVRDFLAFGIDLGYQYFGKEAWKISRNIYFIPDVKMGSTDLGKNKLFFQLGFGFDMVGMGYYEWNYKSRSDNFSIDNDLCLAFDLGAGFMRSFGNSHAGVVANVIFVKNDVCDDGCIEVIAIPSFSLFFGFGK